MRLTLILSICGMVVGSVSLSGQDEENQTPSIAELKKLSVEELSGVEITSVSKRAETLADAAAAVAVVTNEDIRRSGAASVPEVLRVVPGLHVARQGASVWAIASRGFSSASSEKLLVLSDTRSVYTPLVSGVFWDVQDFLLQDVDRIEVIRGPGAALWGSNAVNGVINITTKSAKDTQGLYAEASTGTGVDGSSVGTRYGGTMGDRGYYRVFAKYFDRGDSWNIQSPGSDDWQLGHFGVRTDWEPSEKDTVTLQGDVYDGNIGQLTPSLAISGRPPLSGDLEVGVRGGNVLGRWRHDIDDSSTLHFRAYYDRTHRDDPAYRDDLDTIDLDFQHRFTSWSRQEITWGANYRLMASRTEGKGIFAPGLVPSSSHDHLVSTFVQDQIAIRDSLHLTLGTKLEHNAFSGFEVQPSGRVVWNVSSDHTVWGALSRAVRVPTRFERDIAVDATDPAVDPVLRLMGNRGFGSERLLAQEIGYRWQALASLFIDVAAFHNHYRGLASLELGETFIDPGNGRTILPLVYRNLTDGRTMGVEALVTFTPTPWWRISATSSILNLSLDPAGQDLNGNRWVERASPRHQLGARSFLDLPAGFQFDALFRHLTGTDPFPRTAEVERIPGYAELDVRLAWRGWKQAELSVAGRNLLHARHPEFGAPGSRGEIERRVHATIAWGF